MAAWKNYFLSAVLIIRKVPKSLNVPAVYNIHTYCLQRENTSRNGPVIIKSRSFFNFPTSANKKKEYSGRKLVGYSMEQMYEVVSDVEHYRDFVPFCQRSLVTMRRPGHLKADLVIGFPPVNESYTSSVTMVRPSLVKAVCTEGKLFNHLLTEWHFSPGAKNVPLSCTVDFSVSFEFRSVLHSQLAHFFFNELVRQMESAFITEAKRRFGKASIKSKVIGSVMQAGS